MTIPTARQHARAMKQGRFRLACNHCDRDDFDGVKSLPKDWTGIYRVQSLRESMTIYDDRWEEPASYSVLDWWTHRGTCPDCIDNPNNW